MAEALVVIVLEKLTSATFRKVQNGVTPVFSVETKIQDLENRLKTIQAVLEDAERRQVKEEATVKVWLDKLKDIAYIMDDLLDEWNIEVLRSHGHMHMKKVTSFKGKALKHIFTRRYIGKRIKELNETLDKIIIEKNNFSLLPYIGTTPSSSTLALMATSRLSTSNFDELEVHGRIEDKEMIVRELLKDSRRGVQGLCIISIVGMGGLGKTTLAQLAFHDNEVKSHFELRVWVCVSSPFDGKRIGNAIVEALDPKAGKFEEMETVSQYVKHLSRDKKLCLVLDDVWTDNYQEWEPVKNLIQNCGAKEVKVLVTTRKERVADMICSSYKHHLKGLFDEEIWSMFNQIAHPALIKERIEGLDRIKQDIVHKCKGLPLAVKTLANLMRRKRSIELWQRILNDDVWKQKLVEDHLSPALLLSYYDLPPPVKRCFSYCAIFPKDFVLDRENLIQLWMAQGFLGSGDNVDMEERGNEYFEELVGRSLFQDFVKDKFDGSIIRCKMHDIVHDLALYLAKDECISLDDLNCSREAETDILCKKARHLSLVLAENSTITGSLDTVENIYTLAMYCPKLNDAFCLIRLIRQLKRLRALDCHRIQFKNFPVEAGGLIHLRCLRICRNYELKELPETICTLYYLQTLDLSQCSALEYLPQGIGNLRNLRCLSLEGTRIHYLPKGVSRLHSLRKLTTFAIGQGCIDEACKLNDLRSLKLLHGQLEIRLLKYVEDKVEAEEAELKNLRHIEALKLRFGVTSHITREEQVIEALEPPPLLKKLAIWEYEGHRIPKWMMSLKNIRKLYLYRCTNIIDLPPLGELPSLEELRLKMMWGLKNLGPQFFGLKSVTGNFTPDVFPRLKKLKLERMPLKDWEGIRRIEDGEACPSIDLVLPSLLYFKLNWCQELQSLPYFLLRAQLEKLKITACPTLEERCRKGAGDYWPKISHIPNIIVNGLHV